MSLVAVEKSVEVSGDFPRIIFTLFEYDSSNLLSIEQWGNIKWQSMNSAFQEGCWNLIINAIDAPDLAKVKDMSYMLSDALLINHDFSHWDVSSVTGMFFGANLFDQDLSSWNVTNAADMRGMFASVRLSIINYDVFLLAWSSQSLKSNIVFDGGDSQYSICSQSAKDVLTGAVFNWRISDDGVVP